MDFLSVTLASAAALFLGMVVCGEAGRRLARRRAARDPEGAVQRSGVVDGAVFGLLGLIVAFTFAGAVSRFDARRTLIVDETNRIGTAWLRLDLLPAASQPLLRDSFRRYVDSRIDAYRRLPDVAGLREGLARSQALQSTIWTQALAAAQGSQPATMLLVPALNDMFDITATRSRALLAHPPTIIYVMLFGVALISAAIAGVGMAADRAPDWFRLIAFAGVTAVTFYVILDIEHPRIGLISIDASDQPLIDLSNSMR